MKTIKKCPACGRQIYKYAQVCPYCKGETHFASFDEVMGETVPQEDAKTNKPETPQDVQSPGDAAEENFSEEKKEGRFSKIAKVIKEDKVKVKQEYDKKIGSKYSASTVLIVTVIAILSCIVLGLFIAVQSMEKKMFSLSGSVDNSMKVVIDSVESKMYQTSTIVAKFPDREHHCLVYLKDGHLFVFDAKTKSESEVDLQQLNSKAIVDYHGSGVLNAYLSTNNKYIIIVASRNPNNTEFGLYRLTTDPDNQVLEFIDKGKVIPEKDGYSVRSDMRLATYDSNGDRVSGMSSTEYENLPPKVEKPKVQEKKVEEAAPERAPVEEKVTEKIKPKVDIEVVSKPKVPAVPEKITIKPVETPKK